MIEQNPIKLLSMIMVEHGEELTILCMVVEFKDIVDQLIQILEEGVFSQCYLQPFHNVRWVMEKFKTYQYQFH